MGLCGRFLGKQEIFGIKCQDIWRIQSVPVVWQTSVQRLTWAVVFPPLIKETANREKRNKAVLVKYNYTAFPVRPHNHTICCPILVVCFSVFWPFHILKWSGIFFFFIKLVPQKKYENKGHNCNCSFMNSAVHMSIFIKLGDLWY